MKTYKKFDRLYSRTSSGKIIIWNIRVDYDKKQDLALIVTSTGQEGGKITDYTKKITSGKNIGKKNETTTLEQACADAQSVWEKKQKRDKYRPNKADLAQAAIMIPMSAQYFDSRSSYIDFNNAFVQPKLDGVRCVLRKNGSSINNIKMYSKNGLEFFNLDHIKKDIYVFFKNLEPNICLDGELYTEDFPFNKINGYVRRNKKITQNEDIINILQIKFHVFDCFDLNNKEWKFSDRFKFLQNMFKSNKSTHLLLVNTMPIKSKKEVLEMNTVYVANGYEGVMVRNGSGLYKNKRTRSNDLQKYKSFKDDEFRVIGYEQGTGQDEGSVIWKCITPNKKVFRVRPRGTLEERKNFFQNGHIYVGRLLTVRYQELSEDGVPRFPVGLRIRVGY